MASRVTVSALMLRTTSNCTKLPHENINNFSGRSDGFHEGWQG